jgi:hypothetical protein
VLAAVTVETGVNRSSSDSDFELAFTSYDKERGWNNNMTRKLVYIEKHLGEEVGAILKDADKDHINNVYQKTKNKYC